MEGLLCPSFYPMPTAEGVPALCVMCGLFEYDHPVRNIREWYSKVRVQQSAMPFSLPRTMPGNDKLAISILTAIREQDAAGWNESEVLAFLHETLNREKS